MTTEKSADDAVLDDVFSSERDRGGKSAPPEADASQQTQPNGQEPPAGQQPPQTNPDPEADRMVPLRELTGERKKFQGKLSEAERRAIAAEERAKLLEEQIARASRPQPQQAQRQVQIPDPIADPENYARFVHQSTEERLFQASLDRSEERARDKYGDDVVNEAFKAAQAVGLVGPQSPLLRERHPWGAMVEWHKQQKVLTEVGADPEAFRKKIEDETRAKVLEELKAGNGHTTQGQPQRFPGTLADATATGQQGAHLTDEAVMGAVFASDRNRRK